MGTWGTGPFANDTAADFSYTLDDVTSGDREQVPRGVLTRAVDATAVTYEHRLYSRPRECAESHK